jgi:hypothetical protein
MLKIFVFILQSTIFQFVTINVYVWHLENDSLKACDNGWFMKGKLCWTFFIVWGVFDTHDVSEVGSTWGKIVSQALTPTSSLM